MYLYRTLTPEQKAKIVQYRKLMGYPLHAPPHSYDEEGWFLITAAPYEHKPYFATEAARVSLLAEVLKELNTVHIPYSGWVALPNHYHILVHCCPLTVVSEPIRRAHARTAHELNRRTDTPGRRVWYRFSDRRIRNERHYYTTLNYIHYNPVKHGHSQRPMEWACSSVHWYLDHFGMEWLHDAWREYPVREYGKGWDW